MNLLPKRPPTSPAAYDLQAINCASLTMLNTVFNTSAEIGEQISAGRHLGGASGKRKFNFRETPRPARTSLYLL